jgi:hypothetical protein
MTEIMPINDYHFTGEESLPAAEKRRILLDWQRFIRGGFKKHLFTETLYIYLHRSCGFNTHLSRASFWAIYFSAGILDLQEVLDRFGRGRVVQARWLSVGRGEDLKLAMCAEMQLIYAPLLHVLADLEEGHQDIIRIWRRFAQQWIIETPLPPYYTISENTRNLLAYAAGIAIKRQQPPAPPEPFAVQIPLLQLQAGW